MSTGLPAHGLFGEPAADVTAVDARCRARRLEREGIAMFVALHDARPGHELQVGDPLAITEGSRLADLLGHYDRGLSTATGAEPVEVDGLGADAAAMHRLIEVLVVLSEQHLRAAGS